MGEKDPGTRGNIHEDFEGELPRRAGVRRVRWRAVRNGIGEPGKDCTTQDRMPRGGFV